RIEAGGSDTDEASRRRQDRRRVRKGGATEPGRSDRGGAPRRASAPPRPLGGRAQQHPDTVCWRREGYSRDDPSQGVAAATREDGVKPTGRTRTNGPPPSRTIYPVSPCFLI